MNMVNICSMHDETGEDTHTLLAGKLQGQTTLWRPTSTWRWQSAINPWIMEQNKFPTFTVPGIFCTHISYIIFSNFLKVRFIDSIKVKTLLLFRVFISHATIL